MKSDSYKHAYPRTLLADVLTLLMQQRRIDFAGLENLSGVNRGTIHNIAAAKRSCEAGIRRALLTHLISGDGRAQGLSALFDGDAQQLLAVPELLAALEPSLAARRQQALQDGLDIGALGGRYSLNEIYSDALAMEQAGKWCIACRWAAHMVAAAHRSGNALMEIGSRLFLARLLMASSRFAESRNALAAVFHHSMLVQADWMPGDIATLLRIDANVILGWLKYEIGEYACAVQALDAAITLIGRLRTHGVGANATCFQVSLDSLCELGERAATDCHFPYTPLAELLILALHLRGKVLAEQAMYNPNYINHRSMTAAARAMATSAVVAGYFGNPGMLGHCLLWLARLVAMQTAYIGNGIATGLLSATEERILTSAKMRSAKGLVTHLERNVDPKRLLSIASRECFASFQSSHLNRAYYQRTRSMILALDGDDTGALKSFEDAYDLFSCYAPDARGLGPLLYERYLMESLHRRDADSRIDWLVAAAAIHPSRFINAAVRQEQKTAACNGRVNALRASQNRVLSFQKPLEPVQRMGTVLWGAAAATVMRNNVEVFIKGQGGL